MLSVTINDAVYVPELGYTKVGALVVLSMELLFVKSHAQLAMVPAGVDASVNAVAVD